MSVFNYTKPKYIISSAAVCGSFEHRGPLGSHFDGFSADDKFDCETWEKSEAEMQRLALRLAVDKVGVQPRDIRAIFAGDLINQCTGSAFGALDSGVPFFGLYGACSTIAEGLILASALLESGLVDLTAAVTSSHYCSAERQFRTPLEYGAQRTPTAQRTVTASGAYLISSDRFIDNSQFLPKITAAMPGIITDAGICDAANMGAAMAPAALRTLCDFFRETGHTPDDYELIATGDLGFEGHSILCDLAKRSGFPMPNAVDCGLLIYDRSAQDVHAGGSGCGCSASVLSAYLLDEVAKSPKKAMLFVATGALMSPLTVMQGLSIPGIAHLVEIRFG